MFILFDIGLSLILVLLFIVSYIIIEKIRGSKFFFRWQIYEYLKHALEGIVYGLLIVFFKIILSAIEPYFILPFFIIGVLVLSFIRNVIVGLFAIIAPLIHYVIAYQINDSFYVALSLMFAMLLTMQVVHFFVEDFLINLAINSGWMFLALFSVLTYDFIVFQELRQESIEVIFMPYISLMIVYSGLEMAMKFLISANILYKSVNFNFSRYYRQSLREVVIGEFIDEYKLTRGIYGIFEFNYQKQSLIEKDLEIKESILLDLEKMFPSKAILFRADESRYGFFLPINQKVNLIKSLNGNDLTIRHDKDLLKNIEMILYARSIVYLTSWKEKISLQIRSGVAIYGLQDCSIVNLHNLADFALKNEQSSQKSLVQLFNPSDYFHNLNEEKAINDMDARIKLDNFINYFTPIFDLSTKKTVMHVVTPEKIEYSEIKESVRDFINFFDWTNVFDRYMAFWALANSGQMAREEQVKLAFFYSPQILEKNFNVNNFKKRLLKLTTSPPKIVLVFDPYMFGKIKDFAQFFINLKLLKAQGIQLSVINAHKFTRHNFAKLAPDYVLIDSNQSFWQLTKAHHDIPATKTIWFNIKNHHDFNFALDNKAQLIGGPIFQKSQFISNLDKKSKMYIYELLKNRSK